MRRAVILAFVGAGLAACLAVGSWAQTMEQRDSARRAMCLANMRQLAMAMMMYAQDHENRLPPANRWCDAINPYTRNQAIFKCPADKAKYSYAMNFNLSKRAITAIPNPAKTVMLFESTQGRKNATDVGRSWPARSRHPPGICVAYAEAHCKVETKKPDFRVR